MTRAAEHDAQIGSSRPPRSTSTTSVTLAGRPKSYSSLMTARIVRPQYTEFGESQRPRVLAAMAEFDHALQGRDWLDGERYTIADIVLLTTIDFARFVGIAVPDDLGHLREWHARASARPSAQA